MLIRLYVFQPEIFMKKFKKCLTFPGNGDIISELSGNAQ